MKDFLCGTLLFVQRERLCVKHSLWDVVRRCVCHLQEKQLITVTSSSEDETLEVTRLGRATYKGRPGR